MPSNHNPRTNRRRRKQRGADLIEFTLVLLPLFAIMFTLIDTAWAIYTKATLQSAVHYALRYGVTVTKTQASSPGSTTCGGNNSDLVSMVKYCVQQNSMGILGSTTALSYIHVNFYVPGSGAPTLNNGAGGNQPGNIMQVSVDKYPLPALIPRFFTWATSDTAATSVTAIAADEIEPSDDVPPMGVAP